MPGDENDWDFSIRRGQILLKCEAATARQSHVEHKASRVFRIVRFEKIGNRCKLLSAYPERLQ